MSIHGAGVIVLSAKGPAVVSNIRRLVANSLQAAGLKLSPCLDDEFENIERNALDA